MVTAKRTRLLGWMALLALLLLACGGLPESLPEREQVDEIVDLAQDGVATARALAPTVQVQVATAVDRAQDGVATARAAAPTVQVQAATAAVQAREIATRVSEGSTTALATVRAMGTPFLTLKDRLATMAPDENGNITIQITEAELTTALTWDNPDNEDGMRNIRTRIIDNTIIMTAQVDDPVAATVTVVFEPFVIDGVIQLNIIAGSLGSAQLPRAVLNSAESRINNTLLAGIALIPGNVQFSTVDANSGILTIVGARQ